MFKFKVQRCRGSEDGLGLVGAGVLLCNAMFQSVKSQCAKGAKVKSVKLQSIRLQSPKVQGIGRNVTPPTNTVAVRSTATV